MTAHRESGAQRRSGYTREGFSARKNQIGTQADLAPTLVLRNPPPYSGWTAISPLTTSSAGGTNHLSAGTIIGKKQSPITTPTTLNEI